MKKSAVMAVVLAIAAHWHSQSLAQSGAPINNIDLSKESENPVTRQIMLPLRYEGEFQDGATKATKSTIEIDQAVVPFRLNDDWALITRTKLPAEVLPPKNTGDHWVDGLSNGYTTFFLSPEHGRASTGGPDRSSTTQQRTRRLGSRQMGLRSVRSIFIQGQKPVCIWHGRQQHLVLRRAAWQQ